MTRDESLEEPRVIEQSKDETRVWSLELKHETGLTLQYSNESLVSKIWTGDDQQVISTPYTAWLAPPNKVRVTITPTDLLNCPIGPCRLRTYVQSGADLRRVAETTLKVLAAPGTATPGKVYCSYEDLKRIHPTIEVLHNKGEDQSGFAEQRGSARKEIDGLIVRRLVDDGYSRLNMLVHLNDNRLVVTDELISAACYLTLHRIFQSQLSALLKSDQDYGKLSSYYRTRFYNQILNTELGIDTNGDGVAEIRVNLGGVKGVAG